MNLINNQNPLSNIKVIDFGQYIAAPLVACQLKDQGAEVIHIDPPEGPRIKNEMTSILNRNKNNIILNLKDPSDLESAKKNDIRIRYYYRWISF